MIDEKKLYEALENIRNDCESRAERDLLDYVLDTVEEQPKVGEWIPVEEDFPEAGQDILVTCENGRVDFGFYEGCNSWILNYTDEEAYHVIAFMPLPEPYKEKNKEG